MGPPLLAPDHPAVLKPGKLGLAGLDLSRLTAIQLPPAVMARHAWIYSRLGILFTVKLLQFCFPGRSHHQRLANFQGQTSFRVTPRQAYFVCFPAKMTKFYFSRFHVAGAVGSFICDVSFRHQSHERSQLIFCCDMYNIFTASA